MHIARSKWPSKDGKKVYESIWLRESYREDGKVKTRNIANLKHCKPEEIAAIELALKHKDELSVLGSMKDLEIKEGPSIGALWAIHRTAAKLGLVKVLGSDFQGKLALWQVLARVLDQGSRLSAARLARDLPAAEVLGLSRGFDENDLYENLTWLSERQEAIENRLFAQRRAPELFLYDVTSSYLEGEHNELADWGYNRDKKRDKKQIVIGLLCDEEGEPVSTEVFEGNRRSFDLRVPDPKSGQSIRVRAGDLCRRPRHDQGRPDRGPFKGWIQLHYRHHQASDQGADKEKRDSAWSFRRGSVRG